MVDKSVIIAMHKWRAAVLAAMLAVGLIVGIGPAQAEIQTTIDVLATAGPPHPGLELLETAVVSAGAPPTPTNCGLSPQINNPKEFNNPQAAVNPADPRHLVVTYSIGDGGARVAAASDDSGRSWSGALMPGVTGCTGNRDGGLVNDPFLSIGPDARVYASASWVNWDTDTAKTGHDVGRGYVSAAPAPGATFVSPVDIEPHLSAQRVPLLADPLKAGLVTAFYQHASDVATSVSIDTPIGGCCSMPLPLLGDPLYVKSSTNGGGTYDLLPSVVAEALPGHTHVTIGLQRSGTALVAVRADVDLAKLALALVNKTPIPEELIAHRSTDQGQTWSTGVTLGTFQFGSAFAIPDLTAASDGQLFVTWPEPGTPGRIDVSTSSDEGQSWSRPSAAAVVTGDVFEPAVAARGGGRAAVAFYERNDDQVLERIVSTVDGGTSWSPPQSFSAPFSFAALTGSTDGLPVGPFQDLVATPEGYGAAFTTGLAGSDGVFHEAVTFTRFRDGDSDTAEETSGGEDSLAEQPTVTSRINATKNFMSLASFRSSFPKWLAEPGPSKGHRQSRPFARSRISKASEVGHTLR